MSDMQVYDRIRLDLIKTMKQIVDLAPDDETGKDRMAQFVTAVVDALALALVPYPQQAQINTIIALMQRLEEEGERFEKHCAREIAREAIKRAAN